MRTVKRMRLPFVAGSLTRKSSALVVAPGRTARPFPGPWTLAAITRPRYAEAASDDSCLSASSASRAAPESTISAPRAKAPTRFSETPPT
jgi:hypothetical protein